MCKMSPSALEGYQRCSIANSLPGAHNRLIAKIAVTRDQVTSAPSVSMVVAKNSSSFSRWNSSVTINQKLVDTLPLVVAGAVRSPFDLATLTPESKTGSGDYGFGLGG